MLWGGGVIPPRVVWIMARPQLLQFMLHVRGRHTLPEWPPSRVRAGFKLQTSHALMPL